MFKDDDGAGRTGKRKRERERHDPQKTMKPSEHVHDSSELSSRTDLCSPFLQCHLSSVLDEVVVSVPRLLSTLCKVLCETTCETKM